MTQLTLNMHLTYHKDTKLVQNVDMTHNTTACKLQNVTEQFSNNDR